MSIETIKWFLARSDAEAALKAIRLDDAYGYEEEMSAYIEKFWPSLFGKYADVYRVAGEVEARVSLDQVLSVVPKTWRYQAVAGFMAAALPGYRHVLDFGCSRAAHAINLHNQFGDKRFTCLDIDALSIELAKDICARAAKFPGMFEFAAATEDSVLPDKKYDAAMLLEIMEHVPDLGELVNKIEASVRDGGWVVATVPSGPVEYQMWIDEPGRMREHVREVTLDDICEMFGGKTGLNIQYAMTRYNRKLNMAEGCYFLAWQVDRAPTGEINWDRKLSTERRFSGDLPGEVVKWDT